MTLTSLGIGGMILALCMLCFLVYHFAFVCSPQDYVLVCSVIAFRYEYLRNGDLLSPVMETDSIVSLFLTEPQTRAFMPQTKRYKGLVLRIV